jgi:polynucleotide 5'-hydroxyl-kinase GRC3/NOL9
LQRTIQPNNTLLVDGPASAHVKSGIAEVFGYRLGADDKVLVREGKRLPFFVIEEAFLEVSLSTGASVHEIAGGTVPPSWSQPVEWIRAITAKPVTIALMGKADAGKSSLCTYLVNKLIDGGHKVAVLDGDLGQSDIGPSGTIAYAVTSKPIVELYQLKLENAIFIGVISPIKALSRIVEGLKALQTEIHNQEVDYVLVNTDGWVTGQIAVRYKTALIRELKPDLVVGVEVAAELQEITAKVEGTPVITVEASAMLSPRSPDKRRRLREMTYARYLKGAKLRRYPTSLLAIEPTGTLPSYVKPGRGLLVGFYGREHKFLGVGVLWQINLARRLMKIQTAVSANPTKIVGGQVFLDSKFQEAQD